MNNGAPFQGIWVVVPAYDEARVIAAVIGPLMERSFRVVVVDDGSKDATADISRAAGALVVRHAFNLGQGAALQTGIDFALRQGAQYICTYDADGQHQTGDVDHLYRALIETGADVALGSRFLGNSQSIPRIRRWMLKAAILFTRMHAGIPLSDTHNGLRMFTRRGAEQLRILQPRMAHASEILNRIAQLKLRYVEVPVIISYSRYSLGKGQSALDSLKILFDLVIARALR